MKHYLILWKTWLEEETNTTWDFVFVERTNDFRSRNDTKISIPSEIVDNIYMSFDENKVDKFLAEYIDAYLLSAVIHANDPSSAEIEIQKFFVDAEIVKCVEIPEDMLDQVITEMKK